MLKARTFWFFGLSGSGKTTLAQELANVANLQPYFLLDGDTLREGLNKDLGFSRADREENIRRAAEVARIFNTAGVNVIASFITPLQRHRDLVREILKEHLALIFVDTPLAVCEERDPKGLYKKARAGIIPHFTGISDDFEKDGATDLKVDTAKKNSRAICHDILQWSQNHWKTL